MAWSHGLLSGNLSEALSENTLAYLWYAFGTISSHDRFFLSVACWASSEATVVFLMMVQVHSSSPSSKSGIARIHVGNLLRFFLGSFTRIFPSMVASFQLMVGSRLSRKGYPKMACSFPILAM